MFQSVLRFVGLYFLGGTLSVALRLRVKAMFLAVVFAVVSGQGASLRALCGDGSANRLCEQVFRTLAHRGGHAGRYVVFPAVRQVARKITHIIIRG